MAGMKFLQGSLAVLIGVYLLQGCASTDELFAEYDEKFCVVSEHSNHSFLWEPVLYFASDRSQVFPSDHARLKTNVETMKKLPNHKISLKGFADNQASASYNKILSEKRVDAVAEYLTEELGLSADRIIKSSYGESTPLTVSSDGPVDKERRVEMLLLDGDLLPVSHQPLKTSYTVSRL